MIALEAFEKFHNLKYSKQGYSMTTSKACCNKNGEMMGRTLQNRGHEVYEYITMGAGK